MMKKCFTWILAPALLFATLSCEKKNDTDTTGSPDAPAKEPQVAEPKDPSRVDSLAAKRAEMLGFAGYLPSDTEYLISLHNGSDASRRVVASKVWKTFSRLAMDMPVDDTVNDEDLGEEEVMTGPAMLFAEEFTLAMGQGTSKQLQHIIQINSRSNYFQMSALVEMLASNLMEEEMDEVGGMHAQMAIAMKPYIELLKDEKSGIGMLEETFMPPMYLAFKTTDENREILNQQITDAMGFIDMVASEPDTPIEEVTIERGGSTFEGYQLVGSGLAELMKRDRSDMDAVLTSDVVDQLIEAVSQKNLYLLSGLYRDYIVIFIGSSPDDLVFVDDPGDSLAASNALTFCDAYADKDLLAVCYGENEGLNSVIDVCKGSLASVTSGIRDGLSKTDQFGDTRNIDALLRLVEEREAAVEALGNMHGGGTVAFFENGLKIESFGGNDSGFIDWEAENQLAGLGAHSDAMLFANFSSNSEYDQKMRDYIETIVECAYACTMKVAELPIEDGDMVEFKNYLHLFDTKLRSDLLLFWEGFGNGFDGSLGQERALVIDLQGSMPAIPGVPQDMVDQAKFPRATWIAPVKQREKLAAAWGKMNTGLTNISATVSELAGTEFPMQKPLSSDKDGSTTWFFPLPFFNDDFLPSVTVHDNWFAASTSKLQAIDLIAAAEAGGQTRQGMVMNVNFKELRDYAQATAEIFEKNADKFDIHESEMEMVYAIIEGLSEIQSMNLHVRRESGQLRSSFHFEVAGE